MTRKRIKQKITKVTRLPGNAVVMSLMAAILLCGAPALISVIDDEHSYEAVYSYSPEIISDKIFWKSTDVEFEKGYTTVQTDTGYITVLDDPDSAQYVFYQAIRFDVSDRKDVVGFTISDPDLIKVNFIGNGAVGNHISSNIFAVDGNIDYNLSSYERVSLLNTDNHFGFDVHSGESAEWTVEFDLKKGVIIPYGEIIIGSTGVLLMICALLATPWVGLSGYTGRRIRRR